MTSSTGTIRPVVRSAQTEAFRSAFAAPEELLVLVLVEPGDSSGLSSVLTATEDLEYDGRAIRLAVFGDSSAIASEALPGSRVERSISFLETWASPVLPDLLSSADLVVVLGRQSIDLLVGFQRSGRPLPRIVARSLADDLLGAEGPQVVWDPGDAPGLQDAFQSLLHHQGEGRAQALHTEDFAGQELVPPGGNERSKGSRPATSLRRHAPRSPRVRSATSGDFLLQNDWGIGDELLLSGVAREIVRAYPEARVWIRSRYGFRFPAFVRRESIPSGIPVVETIYQNPTLYGPSSHSPFPGHLVQQMLDKFALDTGLLVKARDVRPELELGTRTAARRIPRSVVLHTRPNPRLPSKDWGLDRWRQLSEILKGEDVRLRQVGGKDEPALPGAEDLRGTPAGSLPEIFRESQAVVCVVGLLMHLAEATSTPAVVIYGGREHPGIDGYPDQVHLSSEPLPCRGRWGCHLAPDLDCPHGMKCMEQITPQRVAREVLSLLGAEREQGR
jgi:hypothetical protein